MSRQQDAPIDGWLEELWRSVRPTVVARVDTIASAVDALSRGNLGAEQRTEAQSAAHRLAGALGAFGFSEATDAAGEVEAALPTASRREADRLRALLQRIGSVTED